MGLKRSLVSVAYELLEKNGEQIEFNNLYDQVCEILGIEDKNEYISYFYTQITLDGRFVTLGGNVWDLRKRHKSDSLYDLHEFDYEDEEEVEIDEDDSENDDLDKDPDEEDEEDEDSDDDFKREDY